MKHWIALIALSTLLGCGQARAPYGETYIPTVRLVDETPDASGTAYQYRLAWDEPLDRARTVQLAVTRYYTNDGTNYREQVTPRLILFEPGTLQSPAFTTGGATFGFKDIFFIDLIPASGDSAFLARSQDYGAEFYHVGAPSGYRIGEPRRLILGELPPAFKYPWEDK